MNHNGPLERKGRVHSSSKNVDGQANGQTDGQTGTQGERQTRGREREREAHVVVVVMQ